MSRCNGEGIRARHFFVPVTGPHCKRLPGHPLLNAWPLLNWACPERQTGPSAEARAAEAAGMKAL